ncbi:hypothetical protein L9F63_025442, partial [Diploptera punctata]
HLTVRHNMTRANTFTSALFKSYQESVLLLSHLLPLGSKFLMLFLPLFIIEFIAFAQRGARSGVKLHSVSGQIYILLQALSGSSTENRGLLLEVLPRLSLVLPCPLDELVEEFVFFLPSLLVFN